MDDEQRKRIIRLVSDGSDSMSGGLGVPLADAFGGVLEFLQEVGTSSALEIKDHLSTAVRTVASKERRVIAVWSTWEAFTQDVIDQLLDKGLMAVAEFGGYELGPKFRTTTTLDVITAAEINEARGTRDKDVHPVQVLIFDLDTRHKRDQNARAVQALRRMQGDIERAGLMDAWMTDWFGKGRRHLEGEGRRTSDRSTYGPQPEDNPDKIVACAKCGQPKPQIRLYYEIYDTRERWAWRPTCKDCRQPERAARRDRVRQAVLDLQDELGRLPTRDEVKERTEMRGDSSIRLHWDELTAMGLLPERNKRPDQL